MDSPSPDIKASSKQFFHRRNDGYSVQHSRMQRMQIRSQLPPFDCTSNFQKQNKDRRSQVNKLLDQSAQNPVLMSKLISELQLVGIDVDSEKLQHSKFESRSTAAHTQHLWQSQNGRSVWKDGSRNSTIKSNSSKMNIQSNIARESLSVPEVNFQSKTLDGIPLSQKKNLDSKNE